MTDCPKASPSGAATARAKISVDPPAGNERTATMGFLGQSVSLAARAGTDRFMRVNKPRKMDFRKVISASVEVIGNIVLETADALQRKS
jgi:hypothetical protein